MARNLGPKHRICRRVGEKLCDLDRCPVQRGAAPPGMHGPHGAKKRTEYGEQLLEKQKARAIYGLMERQFRKYYASAIRTEGDTSALLTKLLEMRLDNVVFRLAFAKSRAAARQLVTHGHITVNGAKVTIPSAQVYVGDVIGVRERSRAMPALTEYAQTLTAAQVPQWLAADAASYEGRVLRLPMPADVVQPFRMQSIVEFYSR